MPKSSTTIPVRRISGNADLARSPTAWPNLAYSSDTACLRSSKSNILSRLKMSSCGEDGVNEAGKLDRGEAEEVASTKASGEGMDGSRKASGDEEVDGSREASGDEEVDGDGPLMAMLAVEDCSW